jgi:hypothetical protein
LGSTITVSSSDPSNDPRFQALNATHPTSACFCTADRPDQWLCYSFGSQPHFAVGYLLRSGNFAPGSVHPKSWAFEGSCDGKTWTEIDRQENSSALDGPLQTLEFQGRTVKAWSHFRIRQIGPNHCGNHCFAFSFFDLIGCFPGGPNARYFPFPIQPSLSGIIAYLTKVVGGNVSAKGAVKLATSGGDPGGLYALQNAVDQQSKTVFGSPNMDNAYFCIDFHRHTVVVTGYALLGDNGERTLTGWRIETAMSDRSWTVVDERRDGLALKENPVIFPLLVPTRCQLFKLVQVGMNRGNRDSFTLQAIEVFGALEAPV